MASDPSTTMSLGSSDDLALVQRILDRRQEALAELYDRYAPLLLGVTRRVLTSPGEAEEALQETFFRVWNQAERFDAGRSSVSAWLVLAARDRALERLRHRQLHGRPLNGSMSDRGVDTLPGVHVEGAAVKDRRARVQAALAAVPSEDRGALGLVLFDGLTLGETAERLRLPLATVKAQALRAMKQLRRDLRAEIRELM
jgi:RNA polymerase sigma-70 factor (ECF subfamily)